MCNAHNHSPSCNCGWGGVWYGSSSDNASWLFAKGPPARRIGAQRTSRQVFPKGGTVPNSKCPVCDAPVYYYESPYGGKVFFDELGPPWPKHPCTDNRPASEKSGEEPWHTSGWRVLRDVSIFAGSEAGIYKLAGVEGSRSYQFHFASDELALGEMVAFKAVGKGIFEVSMLEFFADKGEWTVWSGKAATTPHNLSAEGVLKRTALTSNNPAITVDKNQKLAMVKTKQLRVAVSHSIFLESGSLYVRCHDCKVDILHENFVLHTTRIHGYIPVSVGRRISGRLILKKDDPAAK